MFWKIQVFEKLHRFDLHRYESLKSCNVVFFFVFIYLFQI